MVPDADKSLEYFRSAGETDSTMEDATKLTVINNKKEYDALLKSDKPVVIDFMASWCGKCSMIAPYMEELQVRCGAVTAVVAGVLECLLLVWEWHICNALRQQTVLILMVQKLLVLDARSLWQLQPSDSYILHQYMH